MTRGWPVAVVGSGEVATAVAAKIAHSGGPLGVVATAPHSAGLLGWPGVDAVQVVIDTTSQRRVELAGNGVRTITLVPAAAGPYCIPAVNMEDNLDAVNVNLATFGAQATVPIVAALAATGIVSYAEVVTSMSAVAAGPDARLGIDEMIEITVAAIESVGGAQRAKAVLLLNPAEPPVLLRNTVYCLLDGDVDYQRIETAVDEMVDAVASYAPGYRLRQRIQFESFSAANPLYIPETGKFVGTRVTVPIEIAAQGDELAAYAGGIDIMASAAVAVTERIAVHVREAAGAPT